MGNIGNCTYHIHETEELNLQRKGFQGEMDTNNVYFSIDAKHNVILSNPGNHEE
jgi:hypothetical protein